MDLKNTVSIVTGGSGGLGGRICHALADEGSHVAVTYNSRPEKASAVASELRAKGVEAEAYRCDVASPEQVEGVVSDVLERFGRVDSLINDAAYNKWIPFAELDKMTLDEWDKMIAINLTGPMMFIKAVAGTMKAQGAGRIVNISSVAGMYPRGSSIGYAVSKAGLNHLTRCMAVALAPEITGELHRPRLPRGHADVRQPVPRSSAKRGSGRHCCSAQPTRTTWPTRWSPSAGRTASRARRWSSTPDATSTSAPDSDSA